MNIAEKIKGKVSSTTQRIGKFVFNWSRRHSFQGLDVFKMFFHWMNPSGGRFVQDEMNLLLPYHGHYSALDDDSWEIYIYDRRFFRQLCDKRLYELRSQIIAERGVGSYYEHLIAAAAPEHLKSIRQRLKCALEVADAYAPGNEDRPFALALNTRFGSDRRIRLITWLTSRLAYLDFSCRSYSWLWMTIEPALRYSLLEPCIGTFYFFSTYTPAVQLLVGFCSYQFKDHNIVVFAEEQLPYIYLRYMKVRGTLVFDSNLMYTQAKLLQQYGYLVGNKILGYNLSSIETPQDPSRKEAGFDIGFISSGEWARRFGRQELQPEEYDLIRKGEFLNEPEVKAAESLLTAVLCYAQDHGLTVCIYPHPYERILQQAGIDAPWLSKIDLRTVFWDSGYEKSSEETVQRSYVTVSYQSTLTFKRIEQGYKHSLQAGYGYPSAEQLFMDTLGQYRSFFFSDDDELYRKLDILFSTDE